jgi:hypothetical protein
MTGRLFFGYGKAPLLRDVYGGTRFVDGRIVKRAETMKTNAA